MTNDVVAGIVDAIDTDGVWVTVGAGTAPLPRTQNPTTS